MKKIIGFLLLLIFMICFFNFASAEGDIGLITYSEYVAYKWLYEPDMSYKDSYGKNKVKLEIVAGRINDEFGDVSYDFTMWVKDDIGYYPVNQHVYKGDKYNDFPLKPQYGQRIIIELYPTGSSIINGSSIQSYEIIEENVDVMSIANEYAERVTIPYERLMKYKELYEPKMYEDDYRANSRIIHIDTIIGNMNNNSEYLTSYDLWIKGTNGYYRRSLEYVSENEYEIGQRIILEATVNYNASIIDVKGYDKLIIEEGIDIDLIEKNGIETDPIREVLKKPFDENTFSKEYSYKKILRSPDNYEYSPICFKAAYRQYLKNSNYLVKGDDNNYYKLYIQDEILDFNLLADDKIMIYGYVDGTYTYDSLIGEKTVPSIIVKKIILLEEE